MLNRLLVLTATVTVGVVVGCAVEEANPNVTATEIRATDLEKSLKDNKGKVVLIDCWATWCAPCVKKFPHLVEMHKKYADKGLVCVSLSMDKYGLDDDEYSKDAILKFLRSKGAAFPNFIVAEPKKDEEPLLKLIGDFSAIPYMVMFDRAGKNVWASDQKPKLEDGQLEKLIEEQLAVKP